MSPTAVNSRGTLVNRILLVDDDEQALESMKKFLAGKGFQCVVAKDGGQAHSAFTMRRPDFVILDIILSNESGYEVCERMKQADETVPVLVVSVIDLQDSKNLAERVGADGYLTKPIRPDTLLTQINEIAERVWAKYHLQQATEPEAIRFHCQCGKRFKVSLVHKGRALTCPECGEQLIVPRHQ